MLWPDDEQATRKKKTKNHSDSESDSDDHFDPQPTITINSPPGSPIYKSSSKPHGSPPSSSWPPPGSGFLSPGPSKLVLASTAVPQPPPSSVNPFSPDYRSKRKKPKKEEATSPGTEKECTAYNRVALCRFLDAGFRSRYHTDFEHIQEIGGNSQVVVYQSRNRYDGWMYCVKRSRKQFNSARDKERMLREVFALAALGTYTIAFITTTK